MLLTIIQYGILSLCIISIVHFLIRHLTTNLTAPRVKDLVGTTNAKYDSLLQQISANRSVANNFNETESHLGPASNSDKANLKEYLHSGRVEGNTRTHSSDADTTFLDYPMSNEQHSIAYSSGNDELAYADYD
jgi:hypothetical protein